MLLCVVVMETNSESLQNKQAVAQTQIVDSVRFGMFPYLSLFILGASLL